MIVVEDFLDIKRHNRPGIKNNGVKKIVIHYPDAPGWDQDDLWRYFNSNKERYASCHYIVGLIGDVIHAIPDNEVAWAVGGYEYTDYCLTYISNDPNYNTLSIEICHTRPDGFPTQKAYNATLELCAKLCKKYNLIPCKDVVTHNDITSKDCPLWAIEYPGEFLIFKEKIYEYM